MVCVMILETIDNLVKLLIKICILKFYVYIIFGGFRVMFHLPMSMIGSDCGNVFAEKGRPVMEWGKRMKIALGAAKGLSYLHEDCKLCSLSLCLCKKHLFS